MASIKMVCWVCLCIGGVLISFTAGSPVIAEELSELSAGANLTTTETNNLTTVHINATTEPPTTHPAVTTKEVTTSNVTSPHVTTTAPFNTTTEPSNRTTEHSNMTTHHSNMTTMPSNMTTPDSNMTTMPSNMTTPHSNMTTEPSHTSHGPTNPTTLAPTTTASPGKKEGFDIASFFGGIATAVGVVIIIFVIVHCYNRSKKDTYHAMN